MSDPDLDWVKSTTNELNNLLQGILESAQFLQKSTPDSEETVRYFEIIRNGVERCVTVTAQLQERAAGTKQPHLPAPRRVQQRALPDEGITIHNENGSKELIMIVDDEEFVTLLAQRVLTDEGYRVITVNDGFKALDTYRKLGKAIDLVILDFTMPVMDGSDVFNELRLINPDVAVVLSSGFTEQEKLRWMLSKGLRGFVPKPYTQQKLLHQIRLALGEPVS